MVWSNLKALRDKNYDLNKVMIVHPGKRKRQIIGDAKLEEYLKSEECLRKWAHLSVVKRLEIIRKKWKVDVGYQRL